MPVARIVTDVSQESEALKALSEQLSAAGYEVEVAPPGTEGGAAELVVELEELSPSEALDSAVRLASEADADVFIAPGLVPQPALRAQAEQVQPPENANLPDIHIEVERRGAIGSTLEDLGSARSEGRMGIGDAVSGLRARAVSGWARWQQQRAEAAQALRLARERREMEREERRRQHEAELQRRAEEHQQLLAERERLAAEQERVLREQMARDAALRAERERAEREATAREAARRAEIARAEEQERRRLAGIEAGREPATPPAEVPARPRPAENYVPEPAYADAAPEFRRAPVRPPRRIPSRREQQWQRAALLASVATLAAMIGFALAGSVHRSSPIPASLIQNEAQQQVPFGPAKMDISSAGKAAVSAPASAQSGAAKGRQIALKPVPRATTSKKPSPAKPVPQRRAQRVSRESNLVANDEVIVHHVPARTQRAQSTPGVRRITDEN
jgi:hypothetical protein